MSKHTPTKKIGFLAICAFLVVGAIIVQKYNFFKQIIPASPTIVLNPIDVVEEPQNVNVSGMDTDGDGLPDWQEIISGTDIKNADTDGDGTPDGKEIELGRDPLVKGPNDQNNTKATTTDEKAKTISQSVARNLFANAVYLSNTGSVNEENKAALVDNLVSGIQNSFTYNQYDAQKLLLITNENEETYKFYSSSFATLQISMLLRMQKEVNKPDFTIGNLSPIYKNQAETLFALRVPKELFDIHLQIVNNYSKAAAVFEAISKEKEDPLKLPFAIKVYQDIMLEQPFLIRKVAQFVKDNGIIFTSNEVGGYWNAFE